MVTTNRPIVNGIEIDESKAQELLRWLIIVETSNAKTKEKSDSQMVAAIQKKIEEVVQCY
jgi:hypothetical protein